MKVFNSHSPIESRPLTGKLIIPKFWWVLERTICSLCKSRRLAKDDERTFLLDQRFLWVSYTEPTPNRVWNLFDQLLLMRKKNHDYFGPWSIIFIISIILFLLTLKWLWNHL